MMFDIVVFEVVAQYVELSYPFLEVGSPGTAPLFLFDPEIDQSRLCNKIDDCKDYRGNYRRDSHFLPKPRILWRARRVPIFDDIRRPISPRQYHKQNQPPDDDINECA